MGNRPVGASKQKQRSAAPAAPSVTPTPRLATDVVAAVVPDVPAPAAPSPAPEHTPRVTPRVVSAREPSVFDADESGGQHTGVASLDPLAFFRETANADNGGGSDPYTDYTLALLLQARGDYAAARCAVLARFVIVSIDDLTPYPRQHAVPIASATQWRWTGSTLPPRSLPRAAGWWRRRAK